jgi:hypothetical protein
LYQRIAILAAGARLTNLFSEFLGDVFRAFLELAVGSFDGTGIAT